MRGYLPVIALAFMIMPGLAQAQENDMHMHTSAGIGIPEAMQAEHHEIHERLVAATKLAGPVGVAARDLATVLHPHFQREEEIALPPLGLLAPLSRGEYDPEMRQVLPMTDSLKAELPRMLEEHAAIHAAALRMQKTATAAGNTEVANLADALALHAKSEEQLFYPAAILVGDVVRMRSAEMPAGEHKP